MGFTEVLTIVFIVLKLSGQIDWSWWLVLLPEIIAVSFYTFLMISVFGFAWKLTKEDVIKRRNRFK